MTAKAQERITERHFFDFAEAKRIWTTVKSREALKSYGDTNCPDDETWEQWRAMNNRDPLNAHEALKTHRQADKIKRCYDLSLVRRVWQAVYIRWQWRPEYGWNNPQCGAIREQNIFTNRCDDAPDWRTPEQIAANEKQAQFNKRMKQ